MTTALGSADSITIFSSLFVVLVLSLSDYASEDIFVCLHEKVVCLTSAEVPLHLDEAQRPVTSGLTQRIEGNEVITL
jgi:hypothetical protein